MSTIWMDDPSSFSDSLSSSCSCSSVRLLVGRVCVCGLFFVIAIVVVFHLFSCVCFSFLLDPSDPGCAVPVFSSNKDSDPKSYVLIECDGVLKLDMH
jgi:hypothetical protein